MTNPANPARSKFKPTPEMITAAENVFLAMAVEGTTRPIVEGYQKKIIAEREWYSDPAMTNAPGIPERVNDPKFAWTMGTDDFAVYRKRCNEERIAAKLPAETEDHCPLLVAENITRLAKKALLDTMAGLTNIDGAKAATLKTADYDKLVDITLRLLAPFVKNVLAPPTKRFKAEWGNDYFKSDAREVGIEFFAEDAGYSSEDRHAIDALAVGQQWQASDGSNHTVLRRR